jgi:Protein of unknown function (DUF732)
VPDALNPFFRSGAHQDARILPCRPVKAMRAHARFGSFILRGMAKVWSATFLVAMAVSTSLMGAAAVHADASTDFLTKVSGEGLSVGDTPPDVQLTLETANTICQIIHYGYTPQEAGRQVPYVFPKATPQQVAGFVSAAQETLCVQEYTPLQPGGDY